MENIPQAPLRESDRVEKELRQLILTLQIDPGLSVTEASLINRYGWGRTPLRRHSSVWQNSPCCRLSPITEWW
jgi:DNA-binding GntR family transcriptional regulator